MSDFKCNACGLTFSGDHLCPLSNAPIYERVLHLEKRVTELESGILLKGWTCKDCGVFNGEEKDKRNDCRSCGKLKL